VDLAKSIERDGLLQPIVVMEYDGDPGYSYQLVCGFCRTMAFNILKRLQIPATVHPFMDEREARILNLTENLQRQDLNIDQEARALIPLMKDGLTEQQIMKRIGCTRGWIQLRLMYLKMPCCVQDEISIGALKMADVRELYTIYDKEGEAACIVAANAQKTARKSGTRVNFKKRKDADGKMRSRKKMRNKVDLTDMQTILADVFGPGLTTVILGWVMGYNSDLEAHEKIAEIAAKMGIDYEVPAFK